MTQNEKDLLLKDLCSRLPYGVKVLCLRDFNHEWYNLEKIDIGNNELYVTTYESYENKYVKVEDTLPYLFPLSSMTIEKKGECPCGWSMIDAWIDGKIYLYEDEELNIDEIINNDSLSYENKLKLIAMEVQRAIDGRFNNFNALAANINNLI